MIISVSIVAGGRKSIERSIGELSEALNKVDICDRLADLMRQLEIEFKYPPIMRNDGATISISLCDLSDRGKLPETFEGYAIRANQANRVSGSVYD